VAASPRIFRSKTTLLKARADHHRKPIPARDWRCSAAGGRGPATRGNSLIEPFVEVDRDFVARAPFGPAVRGLAARCEDLESERSLVATITSSQACATSQDHHSIADWRGELITRLGDAPGGFFRETSSLVEPADKRVWAGIGVSGRGNRRHASPPTTGRSARPAREPLTKQKGRWTSGTTPGRTHGAALWPGPGDRSHRSATPIRRQNANMLSTRRTIGGPRLIIGPLQTYPGHRAARHREKRLVRSACCGTVDPLDELPADEFRARARSCPLFGNAPGRERMTDAEDRPSLWFEGQVEQAAAHYTAIFLHSEVHG
jgi:hypothetical protein